MNGSKTITTNGNAELAKVSNLETHPLAVETKFLDQAQFTISRCSLKWISIYFLEIS
ncbi:MAG: hypothetical protein KKC79_09150 [Gammaproteobacteria bacterium]|nr:hypothetical protein [Gammaproteobacteria bacterium]MBU1442171.1 hypothetical protein [Gammaproteobacteria bacterium]MBU2408801.1 hypothetical protein [Gammaproteobacteria bacterium]